MNAIQNQRHPGESFARYRARLSAIKRGTKRYLRLGVPARVTRFGERYVPGPHPTHKPHAVKDTVINRLTGEMQEINVEHPGTLIKVRIPV